jgi:hypothetical protein
MSTSTSCYTGSNAYISPAVNLYRPNLPYFYPLRPFSLVQERAATSPKHVIHLPPSPSPPTTTNRPPLFIHLHTHRCCARSNIHAQPVLGWIHRSVKLPSLFETDAKRGGGRHAVGEHARFPRGDLRGGAMLHGKRGGRRRNLRRIFSRTQLR